METGAHFWRVSHGRDVTRGRREPMRTVFRCAKRRILPRGRSAGGFLPCAGVNVARAGALGARFSTVSTGVEKGAVESAAVEEQGFEEGIHRDSMEISTLGSKGEGRTPAGNSGARLMIAMCFSRSPHSPSGCSLALVFMLRHMALGFQSGRSIIAGCTTVCPLVSRPACGALSPTAKRPLAARFPPAPKPRKGHWPLTLYRCGGGYRP